jgi:hypothetical protein
MMFSGISDNTIVQEWRRMIVQTRNFCAWEKRVREHGIT